MIDEIRSGQLRPGAAPGPDAQGKGGPKAADKVRRADRVEISPEGQALAAKHGADGVSGLSAERVAQLRELIRGGHYDSPQVVDALVGRLLASGDL